MKNFVKILALVLVLSCALSLAACGGQQSGAEVTEPAVEAAPGYTVKVVDAFGNPYTDGVIVRFLQNGQQVTMQVVDENGTVTKDLEKGDYTVELQITGDEAIYYDDSDLTLTADKTSLEVVLYNGLEGDPWTIHAPSLTGGNLDSAAYSVKLGGTYVELEPGERNYFIFVPKQGGKYRFSVQNSDAVLGYYGITHLVQDRSLEAVVDNSLVVEILPSNVGDGTGGTTDLVIGLDATGADTTAILTVERIGDHDANPERDDPYEVYQAQTPPTKFTLPSGTKTADFDLKASTDTYNLVLGDDGYYHMDTADGPLVLVKLGKDSGGSQYLGNLEDMATKAIMGKHFYDENGNYVRKESYNECVQEYAKYVDEKTGLYPLTEDLKYIIQMRGDHCGWFEEANTKHGYIFVNDNWDILPGFNNEITWLVLCCYVKG